MKKIIKIKTTDPFSEMIGRARRAGWYVMAGGLVIFLIGAAITYSTLNTLGVLGLIPSLIGVIIMLPGAGLMGWGWKMIKIKVK